MVLVSISSTRPQCRLPVRGVSRGGTCVGLLERAGTPALCRLLALVPHQTPPARRALATFASYYSAIYDSFNFTAGLVNCLLGLQGAPALLPVVQRHFPPQFDTTNVITTLNASSTCTLPVAGGTACLILLTVTSSFTRKVTGQTLTVGKGP